MNKKKSLLFVCYGLGIGGIEKCLVNLLNALPEEKYDVDLLIMNPEYAMASQIRRRVNDLDPFVYTLNTEITMQEMGKHGGLWKNRRMILPYLDHRVRIKLGLPLWTTFREIEKPYDVAIAYSQNGLAPYYVIDKTRAKRKVLWYHNGAYTREGKQYKLDRQYYPRFDHVVAVSHDCAEVLLEKFPMLEEKILVLRNICDAEDIREKSQAFHPESFQKAGTHIVTVGRLSREKGADLALAACSKLRNEGREVIWHWVGDGPDAPVIREKRAELGLESRFLLEGNQNNPYPYMAYADIYVQPSLYEAYSTTVTEAKILQKPMVVTDVGGMRDQLEDGLTGCIVPIDTDAIAQAIAHLLDHGEIAQAMTKELEKESYRQEMVSDHYEKTIFS